MAVGYTPGSPEQVATDIAGGAHYQLVKIDLGASGATALLGPANPLPVTVRTAPLAGTDRSITATTTSAQLMAANTTRTKFFIKNDTAVDVWINFGAAAAATPGGGNMKILANGGYFEFEGSSSAISIIAASTTAAITAREF